MTENMIKVKNDDRTISVSVFVRKRADKWIICLHGIQSNKHLFDPIFEINSLNSYSILALDLVGFGNSDKPQDFSYDIKDQANICILILNQFKTEKINIIGHSLGGMIGTLLAEKLGDRLESFINLEGNLVEKDSTLSAEVASSSFETFKKKGFPKIKNELRNTKNPHDQKILEWIEQIPDYAFYKTCISIVKWAKSEQLLQKFIKHHTRKLYIYGDKNRFKINVLTKIIPTVQISNAGHFMILENPGDTWQAIEDFLNFDSNHQK